MCKRVLVEQGYVLFTLSYAARRALRRWLGKGDHEILADRIADETMQHFDRARWEVHRRDIPLHSTWGEHPPQDAEQGGSDG